MHAVVLCLFINQAHGADPRLPGQRADAPRWTWAVGNLSVSGQKYAGKQRRFHVENCSATLIAQPQKKQARHIVSAWHCFEHYRDLTHPIVFTLPTAAGKPLQRSARLLGSGGDMRSDWAILELSEPITAQHAPALPVLPQTTDTDAITLAGFSRDDGLGRSGEQLSYHSNCRILSRQGNVWRSNCLAFKGASGGAVVQINEGTAYLVGVVSAGNGEDVSLFIPVRVFRQELRRLMR